MKANNNNQPFVPNKKLIIHFDVDNVLKINHSNKDLFVTYYLIKLGLLIMFNMGLGEIIKK